jgi:type IV secretory pathway component VirB8
MTVDQSFQILVIILSTFLAIFLVLGIILLIKLIQVTNYVKHVMEKAEQIADRAESMSAFFEKSAPTVAVAKVLGNLIDAFKSSKRRGK